MNATITTAPLFLIFFVAVRIYGMDPRTVSSGRFDIVSTHPAQAKSRQNNANITIPITDLYKQEFPRNIKTPLYTDTEVLQQPFWKALKHKSPEEKNNVLHEIMHYYFGQDDLYYKQRYLMAAAVMSGADPNLNKTPSDIFLYGNPITHATQHNDLVLLHILLTYGAYFPIPQQNMEGKPLIFYAKTKDMAQAIVHHDAQQIHQPGVYHISYLHEVMNESYDPKLISLCKHRGLSPLMRTDNQETPLHVLAFLGKDTAKCKTEYLLKGLSPRAIILLINAVNTKGHMATDILRNRTDQHKQVSSLLDYLKYRLDIAMFQLSKTKEHVTLLPYSTDLPLHEEDVVMQNPYWSTMKDKSQEEKNNALQYVMYNTTFKEKYYEQRRHIAAAVMIGADPNIKNQCGLMGDSPLYKAVEHNDLYLLQLLLKHKAQLPLPAQENNGNPVLFFAKTLAMAEAILSHDPTQIHKKHILGSSYLYEVMDDEYDVELIPLCKKHGVPLFEQKEKTVSPLLHYVTSWCCSSNKAQAKIKCLLKNLTPQEIITLITAQDMNKKTPITYLEQNSQRSRTAGELLQYLKKRLAKAEKALVQT